MGFHFRILLSMLLLMVLSMTGTIWVAWQFAVRQDAQYNEQRLLRKEVAIERSMTYVLDRIPGPFYTEDIPLVFSNRICELSDVHGLDISLYAPDGRLLTQSSVEANDAADMRLPDAILSPLGHSAESVERMDLGQVVLAYWNVKNSEDKVVGIAQVRYEKRTVETGDFKSFLIQLAPLYVVLILGGALIAALLSNRLIRILTLIRDRMSELDPSQEQLPIAYQQSDAIGGLVEEYNTLLRHLQKTIGELAQKEREGAWRLMAMQVAHEIKNPLTPIKLGVQQLERSWVDQSPDFDARLKRFCKTASTQIDVLAEIAQDFSLLADIGIQDLEPVNLSKVVEEVTGLFQIGDDHIQWEVEGFGDHVVVRGSMPHLLRVFNNLISNAVHAMVDQPNKVIRIVCESRNEGWQITVQDNGSGIEESQLEQVFQPHFTLKKGGAGLGLTITRSVVNQLGGSIYVSRIQGVWTEFILWFPVV